MANRMKQDPTHRVVTAAAQAGFTEVGPPTWYRALGVGAWLTLGIAALVVAALLLVALVADVAIPLVVAAVLAAILVPLTDRLERWRVPRWLGATLVLILSLALVAGTVALVIGGLLSQSDEIWAQLDASLDKVGSDTAAPDDSGGTLSTLVHDVVRLFTGGILGSLFSSAGSLVIGCVLAVFMLLFLLKDWGQITGWTVRHLGIPVPAARTVFDRTVQAFRGYAAGLTLIGLANALVVAVGALLLGVPLPGTIALVAFVTSYVPYIGAFVAGAFAVLIAYGSGGLGDALAMLAIVLLANNTIQNVVEPFAFGARLRLHPLAVLLTVTTATMLFGVMGAVLAAPLTSAAVSTVEELRRQGVFGPSTQDVSTSPPDAGDSPDVPTDTIADGGQPTAE